jgi:AcrR family transcriptional regulator
MSMNRNEHKNELKRRVLKVSRELFLKKGYRKTTISEIISTVGITTGSLYHFFKSKEDILLHITQEVFDGASALSDALTGEKAEPWLRFSLEIGIQLEYLLNYDAVAELYLVAHESADISQMIVHSAQIRNHMLFQTCCPDFTFEDHYTIALAVKGIIHSFVQETVYNRKKVSTHFLFRAIEMALLLYNVPALEIEKSIRKTHSFIQKIDVGNNGFLSGAQ